MKNHWILIWMAIAVVIICIFLLGELTGFRYGYRGALVIENTGYKEIEFATHGVSYLSPIVLGYIAGFIGTSLFIFLLFKNINLITRLLILSATAALVIRGLYYKYLVISLAGEQGFRSPYQDWMHQAAILDCVCIAIFATIFVLELWFHRTKGT